ncbi:hypothetical protein GCM10010518_24650 [Kitasatospora cinereorecta]
MARAEEELSTEPDLYGRTRDERGEAWATDPAGPGCWTATRPRGGAAARGPGGPAPGQRGRAG